jgi:hypothetical protein
MKSDSYEYWPEEKLLGFLAKSDVGRPAGFAIEVYRERFPITDRAVPVLERFLVSPVLDNRSAAIQALVDYGGREDYVVDALVLHFLSRDPSLGSQDTYATLRSLEKMKELGNPQAAKALVLLRMDPYVRDMTEF